MPPLTKNWVFSARDRLRCSLVFGKFMARDNFYFLFFEKYFFNDFFETKTFFCNFFITRFFILMIVSTTPDYTYICKYKNITHFVEKILKTNTKCVYVTVNKGISLLLTEFDYMQLSDNSRPRTLKGNRNFQIMMLEIQRNPVMKS